MPFQAPKSEVCLIHSEPYTAIKLSLNYNNNSKKEQMFITTCKHLQRGKDNMGLGRATRLEHSMKKEKD